MTLAKVGRLPVLHHRVLILVLALNVIHERTCRCRRAKALAAVLALWPFVCLIVVRPRLALAPPLLLGLLASAMLVDMASNILFLVLPVHFLFAGWACRYVFLSFSIGPKAYASQSNALSNDKIRKA